MGDGVVVDIGKSGTRCWLGGEVAEGAGLAPEDAGRPRAGDRLADAVTEAWRRHPAAARVSVTEVAVGTTFLPPADEVAVAGRRLRRLWPDAAIAIAEDGVLAHAFALGRPGVVASVGTGTIVIGLDRSGRSMRADGWGPDLGDRGSAWAIGVAGMRAAYSSVDGVAPASTLASRLRTYLGADLDHGTAASLLADPDRVRTIAGFAVEVSAAAAAADEVAAGILAAAADDLADTIGAVAVRCGVGEVALVGGLTGDPRWRSLVEQRCRDLGLVICPAGTLQQFDPGSLLRSPYLEGCSWSYGTDGNRPDSA